MASDINQIAITGNLVADPELRQTRGGTGVLNFRIASNYAVKNRETGEWEDRPNYVSCVILGARAEPLSRILHKGLKVCVSGSLRYREWEGEDGQRHSMHEIHAESVVLMSQPRQSAPQTPQEPQSAAHGYGSMYDADVPF